MYVWHVGMLCAAIFERAENTAAAFSRTLRAMSGDK